MKVKVKKINNAPQFYDFITYVPKANISFGPSTRVCAPKADFMDVCHNPECVSKCNFLYLSDGQLYGKRSDVLNHIAKIYMLPSGSVISLVSLASGELTHWIITDTPTGFLRIPHFGEE